ncbi:class I SAM-dependent RNA methyltransferase [Candidatus Peregrinibacteria bacterium]|nr:class I SAM-dependent RNA methyltransferase [Candidatus Peregrinibacteria bacterium]
MQLIATCAFGLEKIVFKELKALGLWIDQTEDGRVTFQGEFSDLVKANLWLRTADRIQIKLAEFPATTFDQLFDATTALDWDNIIPKDATFPVLCSTSKSTLHNEPSIQSIVKKAIVKKLLPRHSTPQIPETGPTYSILARFNKDICTLSLDTTGDSLHKRGYRTEANLAPLKETLAAALILLSDWKADRPLIDPFCGSGTILIEAAMIGLNIAPGLNRNFTFESWPDSDKALIKKLRYEAAEALQPTPLNLQGSDFNPRTIDTAHQNIERAGLTDQIKLKQLDVHDLDFAEIKNSTIITNPPYGERLSEISAVEKLYAELGKLYAKTQHTSLYILASHPEFQKVFGQQADKNRKLFNGKIKCWYYQYLAK